MWEIGIRIALGTEPSQVIQLIARQAIVLGGTGCTAERERASIAAWARPTICHSASALRYAAARDRRKDLTTASKRLGWS
jgi:hypothetical protein